jgi:transposase-like protein
MAGPDLVNLPALIDDAKCFALVRQHRWPEGVRCPFCASPGVIRDGYDETQRCRQRYRCKECAGRFDDLTGTMLAGRHQPLRIWVLCLYFMGLNLSNRQIAQKLDLSVPDAQVMTDQLRHGLVANTPAAELEGEVEIDESLLCSWLRPHRGISQEKLPDYLGFFQFVHNVRRGGKELLSALIAALVR